MLCNTHSRTPFIQNSNLKIIMKNSILLLTAMLVCSIAHAQTSFQATIKDINTQEPLVGVSAYFPFLKKGNVSDIHGKVIISAIPNGTFTLEISYIGYESLELPLTFPLPDPFNLPTLFMTPSSSIIHPLWGRGHCRFGEFDFQNP